MAKANLTMAKEKGTKRKIEIKKRDTKQQRAVACSKRRPTLFSKAADLCLVSGANIAVFVTSPSENSDVVYSFSGYSSASEIAHCYLNGKLPPKINTNPQPKLGFWWEDPDLYSSCDDLSELNVIKDRLEKTKKDLMACLEKKENSQFVSKFDQNPSNNSADESCPQIVSFHQNPSSDDCGASSSQFVSDVDQKPTALPSPHMVSFDQNPNSSLDEICGLSFDQNPGKSLDKIFGYPCSQVANPNPSSSVEEIYGESLSVQPYCFDTGDLGFANSSLNQIYGESCYSQVATFDPNISSKANEEEDDYMVNIEELFSEEELGLLGFCEFID